QRIRHSSLAVQQSTMNDYVVVLGRVGREHSSRHHREPATRADRVVVMREQVPTAIDLAAEVALIRGKPQEFDKAGQGHKGEIGRGRNANAQRLDQLRRWLAG